MLPKLLFSVFFFFCLSANAYLQVRYVDEVFTDDEIEITEDVLYGSNIHIPVFIGQSSFEFELEMDLYQPSQSVDSESARPLIVLVHGGDYFPENTIHCFGDKQDWISRTTAQHFARLGYVVAVPNYRLFWNPLAPLYHERMISFFNARIRAAQDLKACVRYMKKEHEESSNPLQIDPDKIAYWGVGEGAGGIIQLAAYAFGAEDFEGFGNFIPLDQNFIWIYNPVQTGEIEGQEMAFDNSDELVYIPNHIEYSSEVQLVAAGNALQLDTTLFHENEPPLISFANPKYSFFSMEPAMTTFPSDLFGPFYYSQTHARVVQNLGLNEAWSSINSFIDEDESEDNPLTEIYDPIEGLKGIHGDPNNESPWYWWEEENCNDINYMATENTQTNFPGASEEIALLKLDSMINYFIPRACITLDLSCITNFTNQLESPTNENSEVQILLLPNPSSDEVQIEFDRPRSIEWVSIYNLNGQRIKHIPIRNGSNQIDVSALSNGVYSIQIKTKEDLFVRQLTVLK